MGASQVWYDKIHILRPMAQFPRPLRFVATGALTLGFTELKIIIWEYVMADEQPEEKPNSLDILGIKPISNAIDKTTETAISFINRICGPAADEFGLLLQDRVKYWRKNNLFKMLEKAKNKVPEENALYAHPRIVNEIIQKASWIDDEEVQSMWAGLLASSCTDEGNDESNLIFINILSQMTSLEAKMVNKIFNELEKLKFITRKFSLFLTNKTISPLLHYIDLGINVNRIEPEILHLISLWLLSSYTQIENISSQDKSPNQISSTVGITFIGRPSPELSKSKYINIPTTFNANIVGMLSAGNSWLEISEIAMRMCKRCRGERDIEIT